MEIVHPEHFVDLTTRRRSIFLSLLVFIGFLSPFFNALLLDRRLDELVGNNILLNIDSSFVLLPFVVLLLKKRNIQLGDFGRIYLIFVVYTLLPTLYYHMTGLVNVLQMYQRLVVPLILYIIVINYFKRQTGFVFFLFLSINLLHAGYAMYQVSQGDFPLMGFSPNNSQGFSFDMLFCTAFYILLLNKPEAFHVTRSKRLIVHVMIPINAVLQFFAFNRVSLVGLFLLLAYQSYRMFRRNKVYMAFVAILVLLSGYLFASSFASDVLGVAPTSSKYAISVHTFDAVRRIVFGGGTASTSDEAAQSLAWRFMYWNNLLSGFSNYLTGAGVNSVLVLGTQLIQPHNDWLKLLVETGIIGLGIFLYAHFWLLREYHFERLLLLMVVSVFVIMLTDNFLWYAPSKSLFFLFIAVYENVNRVRNDDE